MYYRLYKNVRFAKWNTCFISLFKAYCNREMKVVFTARYSFISSFYPLHIIFLIWKKWKRFIWRHVFRIMIKILFKNKIFIISTLCNKWLNQMHIRKWIYICDHSNEIWHLIVWQASSNIIKRSIGLIIAIKIILSIIEINGIYNL